MDAETFARVADDTINLAWQFGLTVCDAAYLELAMCRRATPATTDRDLANAATAAGVTVILKQTKKTIQADQAIREEKQKT